MTNNGAQLYDLLLILCDFPEECGKNMVYLDLGLPRLF